MRVHSGSRGSAVPPGRILLALVPEMSSRRSPREIRISLTMEIYTQVPDAATRAALRRLSDALGGGIVR